MFANDVSTAGVFIYAIQIGILLAVSKRAIVKYLQVDTSHLRQTLRD